MKKKRVAVFGTFDGIHDGHRSLFEQARKYGDELVAIVARDETAEMLKGKKPKYSESERLQMVEEERLVDKAVLGDERLSNYEVLEQLKPDVVCLGYDQRTLRLDIQRWRETTGVDFHLEYLDPYKPEKYHSSLFDS